MQKILICTKDYTFHVTSSLTFSNALPKNSQPGRKPNLVKTFTFAQPKSHPCPDPQTQKCYQNRVIPQVLQKVQKYEKLGKEKHGKLQSDEDK